MKVLYVRVSDQQHEYVKAVAAASGLSLAKVVDGLLSDARMRGVTIQQVLLARAEGSQEDA